MKSKDIRYRMHTIWEFIGKYYIMYYYNNNVVAYLDRVTLTQYYLEQGIHFRIDIAFTIRYDDHNEWYLNSTVFKSLYIGTPNDL